MFFWGMSDLRQDWLNLNQTKAHTTKPISTSLNQLNQTKPLNQLGIKSEAYIYMFIYN